LPFHSHDLAPISAELSWVWSLAWGTDGSPKPVLRWFGNSAYLGKKRDIFGW
jgi:hypothetical protein